MLNDIKEFAGDLNTLVKNTAPLKPADALLCGLLLCIPMEEMLAVSEEDLQKINDLIQQARIRNTLVLNSSEISLDQYQSFVNALQEAEITITPNLMLI